MSQDKYDQDWVRWFARDNYAEWAITLGQTTYYSCPSNMVSNAWRRHEAVHKAQWKRDGWKSPFKRLWYILIYSHRDNPYEKEAVDGMFM